MTIRYHDEQESLTAAAAREQTAERVYMGSTLTMEPAALLQQQLPLHNEYSLSSDQEFADNFSGHHHVHQQSYASNGVVEPLRRDGSLPHQTSNAFAFATNSACTPGPRYVPDRSVAPDAASHPNAHNFTDSSSGSISTSPSSAASSLAAQNYSQTNYYTGLPTYPGPVSLPQSFVPQTYADTRVPSLLNSTGQGMLPPPTRPSISNIPNVADRDSYNNSTPYSARNQLSPSTQSSYTAYVDTPRGYLSPTIGPSLSGLSSYRGMATPSSQTYGSQQNESINFPWPTLEVLLDLTCEGQQVTPEVHAKVEKGFFPSQSDQKWTCYRRNYFSVACNFELHPNINNGRLFLKRNNGTEQVQAMGMRLSAAVDDSSGKSIELVQYTPKRDNGAKAKIEVTKVSPSPATGRPDHTVSPHGVYQIPMQSFHATGQAPGPYLPLQNVDDGRSPTIPPSTPALASQYGGYGSGSPHLSMPGPQTVHTFERVQFKQATANNGKRRASQQYFHLIVELFADVRKEGSDNPVWVKVAQRVSDKIVVRGRSPSHYQNEGQNGAIGRGGANGGSGGYTSSGASYVGMNTGGFRSSGSHYSGSMSGGSNGYRTNAHYGLQHLDSHSGSSSGSPDEGGPMDGEYGVDAVMSDSDRMAIHEPEGYQYYPSTIYEGMAHGTGLPPLAKIEANARYSTEPRQYAVKPEYGDAVPGAHLAPPASIGRFQGVDSSRGYYSDLPPANYT